MRRTRPTPAVGWKWKESSRPWATSPTSRRHACSSWLVPQRLPKRSRERRRIAFQRRGRRGPQRPQRKTESSEEESKELKATAASEAGFTPAERAGVQGRAASAPFSTGSLFRDPRTPPVGGASPAGGSEPRPRSRLDPKADRRRTPRAPGAGRDARGSARNTRP
ncbi:MAG: hypothetical protein DMF83_11290 [Acidobacteria bacterium]|nr:MAG: hypothetical protein DMF83_11290 [Acidobacteriota bacterium]